jgi:predicted nucleic acid-binding protein
LSDSVPRVVLDSFALLAYFQSAAGGPRVRQILESAERDDIRLSMTVVNQAEVFYKTVRHFDLDRAFVVLARMRQFKIDLCDVDWEMALAAARIKGTHRMSYADCLAAALAQRLDAALVTGDPEFRQVEDLIAIEWLPVA